MSKLNISNEYMPNIKVVDIFDHFVSDQTRIGSNTAINNIDGHYFITFDDHTSTRASVYVDQEGNIRTTFNDQIIGEVDPNKQHTFTHRQFSKEIELVQEEPKKRTILDEMKEFWKDRDKDETV